MSTPEQPDIMPAIFVGHGSPMNAIENNRWSRGFVELAQSLPRPRAILSISAHWYTSGTLILGSDAPRTIHDFGGFPQALYEIQYPAPGASSLATQILRLIGEDRARIDNEWGLDHGTWSVLRWMYDRADVPVLQLSIDRTLSPQQHYELGRSLAELRSEGVLLMGSGNVVHNLRDAFSRMRSGSRETPDWARDFDADVAAALLQRDRAHLVQMAQGTDAGRLAHPTPDHWLPLLYVAAASSEADTLRFSNEGFDLGSISMRNVILG